MSPEAVHSLAEPTADDRSTRSEPSAAGSPPAARGEEAEAGLARRTWGALTEPRGNRLWDGVIRSSGLLGLLGILLVVALPDTGPLVGFAIFTVWMTGPLSPLFPTGYEPVLMVLGRVYAPLLVAAVGMATQLYVEFLNYHLHRRLLALDAAEVVRESEIVDKLRDWFDRYPFFTVWFCAWSPVPYWTVRILGPLSGYPMRRYLTATVLGRFPKLWIFAALGVYWTAPSDALLLGIAGGTMVLGLLVWSYKHWRSGGDREEPTAWKSADEGRPGLAGAEKEE